MLLTVGLPLALAIIMFTLGLGLAPADFGRVAARPRAFLTGAVAQLVVLPLTAFALLSLFPLPPGLAFGVMLLAFCPGGVTTNMLTRWAGGDLALSISLTGVISLVSVVTLPIFVALAAGHFLDTAPGAVNVTSLGLAMVAITLVPVLLGMALRAVAPALTARLEVPARVLGAVLFTVILLGALASNWSLFAGNIAALGPILVVLNLVLLAAGYGLARLVGLGPDSARAISIEGGVQNGTLGITVAGLLVALPGAEGAALPSAVYGVTMYLVTLPVVFGLFRRGAQPQLLRE